MPGGDPSEAGGAPSRRPASTVDDVAVWDDPSGLRGEILSDASLQEHARALARAHGTPTTRGSARPLRRRFRATRKLIRQAYASLAKGAERKRDPSPAEVWLLDNGHVVEGQLREIEEDLPWGYLIELPRMSRGAMRGYPLVYGLCLGYLRHTDCHLDFGALARFVDAYQSERVLTIGELWAIPIMLRLGLLLAVGALAVSEARADDRDWAEQWADGLLGVGAPSPEAAAEGRRQALARLARWEGSDRPSDAFLVTLLKRLHEREDAPSEALDWIAHQTALLHTTPDELARRYHVRQAADQVSVGNAITSMRSINSLDWSEFFRATSRVEGILARDPLGVYTRQDDATRDRCRHAVEKWARLARRTEVEVADAALGLAERQRTSPEEFRAHVGYYLLDDGRAELQAALAYRPPLHRRWGELVERRPGLLYLGAIALSTLLLALLAWLGLSEVDVPLAVRLFLAPALLLPASEISVAIVNAAVVTLLPPRILPKFEFDEGIPAEHHTLVVVPTLLESEEGLARLLEELEVRSLANADEQLSFALLTDFPDADVEESDADRQLLELARSGIETLNAGRERARFHLLHRRRKFDPIEGRYLGWERKRGKLTELNRLLRGATDTSFQLVTAPPELLRRVRFVITLDTDTELPLGVARRLVATLAHPLNRPWVDPQRRRVWRGHAIVQPRVGTSPKSARRSIFARLSAGPPGIDPYTTAVSDVYQDLFGEGSFVGKGIYDVDAFEAVMSGRVPENQVLSHDLLESIYARSALASDIEVLDEQPSAYVVAAGRQHRWTRGDWQLLPWLMPRVPVAGGTARYDFRAFDAWRVLDNLRRSLLAPALVLLAACTWLLGGAWVGSLLVAAVFVVPVVGRTVFAFARSDSQLEWLGGLSGDLKSNAQQALVDLVFLLDRALVSGDAIVRALHRQFVSRRHMLEWTSMRSASSQAGGGLGAAPRLSCAAALAVLLAGAVALGAPSSLPVAAPILVLWVAAPLVAVRVSRVEPWAVAEPWGPDEVRVFRRVARKTWRFFERFVGDDDHHLPPDNFQEEPRGVVAHRTSPTNIGLYLLSVASARDLGFVTLDQAVTRWQRTLDTIERLEKREGHVLNWYDTQTLSPLEPRYVSTVDSGNLAGYLWTLSECCRELRAAPLVSGAVFEAALAAARLARESADEGTPIQLVRELEAWLGWLERAEDERRARPAGVFRLLEAADREGARRLAGVDALLPEGELRHWLEASARTLGDAWSAVERELPHVALLARAQGPSESSLAPSAWATLEELVHAAARPDLSRREHEVAVEEARRAWPQKAGGFEEFEAAWTCSRDSSSSLAEALDRIGERAERLASDMNFAFLYDERRALFSIGYNVSSARLDGSHYDLLASEARLASLVAIAKGDVPEKHWFRLGRLRARYASVPGLLSWSGSMFEYLMPLLVMRSFTDTLLDQTCHAVIEGQIAYGRRFGVPWGVSEAAYNVMDLGMNYQYRAFGVPGLGLKPGLGEDLVVAPYATALAALVRARAAAENFARLSVAGLDGRFGFYESVDYTPARLPPGREKVVVKAFMAHHQGMTLVALSNLLCDFAMQRRFHSDPRIKACALLLEERSPPRAGVVQPETPRIAPHLADALESELTEHLDWAAVRSQPPRGHLLGQGSLSTWITGDGTGFLTWRGLDVTRFREDPSLGCGGIALYVRDRAEGRYWSSGYLPARAEPDRYDVTYSVDKVELARRDGDIETLTEITLSPEHSAEVRRLTLTNHGERLARLDVTSFTELALAPHAADVAHPAFQKLFLESELLEDRGVLLVRRRKRSEHDPDVWMAQLFVNEEGALPARMGASRGEFLGRGGSLAAPLGLLDDAWIGSSTALDPALVLRWGLELGPGEQTRLCLVTLLGESREALLDLVEQFAAAHSVPRAFELAWADARVELRHLGISSARAHRYQHLLSAVLFPQSELRGCPNPPISARGRDALWAQGISGDLPIVLLRLDHVEFSELCRDLLLAHEFWRINGVATDLVILNEEEPGYLQPVQEAVSSLVRATPAEGHLDQRGGVFLRRRALVADEDLQLIFAQARVTLSASRGSLSKQLRASKAFTSPEALRTARGGERPPERRPRLARPSPARPTPARPTPSPSGSSDGAAESLAFDNRLGGFAPESGEYVMRVGPGRLPPQPWSNVIAGPRFGTLVTESGSSFTWYENSQKFRLTPWSNDATLDPSGELFFVRDLEAATAWSLTPAPRPEGALYRVTHGQGYSSFEHTRDLLEQTLTVAADPEDTVKVGRVTLRNRGARTRRLRVLAYVEWVLGNHRDGSRIATLTIHRPDLRTVFARNPFSPFPRTRAFFTSTEAVRGATGDRVEFFGRWGSREHPAALDGVEWEAHFGAGFDPCAAFEVELSLAPGEERTLAFVLGHGEDERQAFELASRYGRIDEASALIERSRGAWQERLGRLRVRTPDLAFDLMINHWLPYQVLSCRFWGRSGFFQSGGAYGFRDQLQDSLAFVHWAPELTREHLLLSASRQFVEGDVQHWWHSDTGEGVRTQCSDDLLWLPWAAVEYAESTGDVGIWDERVAFLQERLLNPGEEDLYSVPPTSGESASLYEHCVRALQAGNVGGPSGLPTMRGGDWNDGMNRIGREGRGESVWLAWFLAHVLDRFEEVATRRGDVSRAAWCRSECTRLGRAIDASAWDGAWYRRATFDEGTPVGSASSAECRIDAIAQSWAVIAGVGRPERAERALDSSLEHLWRRDEQMMSLLTPPFTDRGPDPGYIAAYPPGVRENGGQYTHGVLWSVWALLLLGRGEQAHELFSDLNPIRHTTLDSDLPKYRAEPYVLAADVYSEPPHVGRGGWTWYTGSAAWMYRLGVEWMLGLKRHGDELELAPCVPPSWTHFEVEYRAEGAGTLSIVFENPSRLARGRVTLSLEGRAMAGDRVPLPRTGEHRQLHVRLEPPAASAEPRARRSGSGA